MHNYVTLRYQKYIPLIYFYLSGPLQHWPMVWTRKSQDWGSKMC